MPIQVGTLLTLRVVTGDLEFILGRFSTAFYGIATTSVYDLAGMPSCINTLLKQ